MKRCHITLCILLLASFLTPGVVLYALEDMNTYELQEEVAIVLSDRNKQSEEKLIQCVFAKYSNQQYHITTSDEYALTYYESEDQMFENETLLELKELEAIHLLKEEYFTYLKDNQQMITRINEYNGNNMSYSKKRIFLAADDFTNAISAYEIENTSKKIISLKIEKRFVSLDPSVMKAYIKYLEIDADDWEYHENYIFSAQKQIQINIELMNDIIAISLVPYSNN